MSSIDETQKISPIAARSRTTRRADLCSNYSKDYLFRECIRASLRMIICLRMISNG